MNNKVNLHTLILCREITDRTILKLFEIDQATGAPKTALGGHDVRESGGLGPGNKGGPDGGSQYASMSTIADAAELPGGKTGENTDMKVGERGGIRTWR